MLVSCAYTYCGSGNDIGLPGCNIIQLKATANSLQQQTLSNGIVTSLLQKSIDKLNDSIEQLSQEYKWTIKSLNNSMGVTYQCNGNRTKGQTSQIILSSYANLPPSFSSS